MNKQSVSYTIFFLEEREKERKKARVEKEVKKESRHKAKNLLFRELVRLCTALSIMRLLLYM